MSHNGVPIQDISDTMGHKSTHVTETFYRHVIVPAIRGGASVMDDALPLDERTFLTDPADPDSPAVTFGAFDAAGRPRVLYDMLWGLPRLGG